MHVRPSVELASAVHGDALGLGVCRGQAVLRHDHEGVGDLIAEHERGRIGRLDRSGATNGRGGALAEVQPANHRQGDVAEPAERLLRAHRAPPAHASCHPSLA